MGMFWRLAVKTAFSEPPAVGIALYVRDRLGLDAGLAGSPASRLSPAVAADPGLTGSARDAISAQWGSWWTGVFGATVLDRAPGPIDYYGPLVHEPDLDRAAEPLLHDAIAWVAAQADFNRGEWGDIRSPTFRPILVREMIAATRPRVRGKVKVRFLVLPVEDGLAWRVGPSCFAVSKPLLHDLPGFREWFAAQIPNGLSALVRN